jgi:EpsI family protein
VTSARWRAVVAAALMLVGAAVTYWGKPTAYLADQIGKPDLEALFPKAFGPWRVDANQAVVLPSPDVQAQLSAIYNQVLTRTYVNPSGQRIMLSVAYGGDQYDGTSAHRPEVCYPAQGFDITFNQKNVQRIVQGQLGVRNLVAKLGGRNEPITYWVVVGNEIATTGIEQKLAQMRYGVRGVIADGMLVRVSSINSDRDQALALQASFITDMAVAIPEPGRSRVFGNPLP